MRFKRVTAGALAFPLLMLGVASAATLHVYSYDPADAQTGAASGPLTFEVRKGLIGGTTILNLRSTVAQASADLKRADPKALGPIGTATRDLYQIEPADQGAALISALCPGATRGWMAFSPVRFDQGLTIQVLGAKASAPAWSCHKLAYDFHGEWKAPPSGVILRERDILHGRYPGT